jgi:hypothetical protein
MFECSNTSPEVLDMWYLLETRGWVDQTAPGASGMWGPKEYLALVLRWMDTIPVEVLGGLPKARCRRPIHGGSVFSTTTRPIPCRKRLGSLACLCQTKPPCHARLPIAENHRPLSPCGRPKKRLLWVAVELSTGQGPAEQAPNQTAQSTIPIFRIPSKCPSHP